MSDLRELYQEVIVDHGRRPRNFGALADHNHRAKGVNPLCGDRLTLYLKIDGDVITDASFEGAGCAISTASASLLTEALKGKSTAEAEALFDAFHALVTGGDPPSNAAEVGKLQVLAGVREFPSRIKCATLAWHAMRSALADGPQSEPVSTE